MLLYNVTITIDRELSRDWLQWMKDTHIPDVMSTGMFVSYRLSRLLDHEHNDSEIFSVQYLCRSMADLARYQQEFAPELQKAHTARYAGRFVAFRTLMEVEDHNERL